VQHDCHPGRYIWNLFCLGGCIGATIGFVAFMMIYGEAVMDPKGYADRRTKEWAAEFQREQARMYDDE
jgi:hypothetical protein